MMFSFIPLLTQNWIVCSDISEADDDSSRKSDRSEDSDFEIDDIYMKKQLIFGNK